MGISTGTSAARAAAAWGASNNVDSATFVRHVRQTMTTAYMKGWMGKRDLADFRQSWHTYFNENPKKTDYLKYIKGGWDSAQLKEYIQSTPQFKAQYIQKGFKQASAQVQASPATFRAYLETFNNTMKQYGLNPTTQQARLFFGGQQTPDTFAQNLNTVMSGQGIYNTWTGTPLTRNETNAALYGYTGGENARGQIVRAYQMATNYRQSKVGQFNTSLNDIGRPVQSAY